MNSLLVCMFAVSNVNGRIPSPVDLALSLCGGIADLTADGSEERYEAFEQCRLTFDALCSGR